MRLDSIQDVEVYVLRHGEAVFKLSNGTVFSAKWTADRKKPTVYSSLYLPFMRKNDKIGLSKAMELHEQIAMLFKTKLPATTKDFVRLIFNEDN